MSKDSGGSHERNEKVKRGQTLRTETTRDRSDDKMGYGDTLGHKLDGGDGDLSHSISGNKVPEDQ